MVLPTAGRSSLGTSRRDLVSPATAPFLLRNCCQKADSSASLVTAAPACSMAARSSLIFSSIVHLCSRGAGQIKRPRPWSFRDEALVLTKLRGTTRVPHLYKCGALSSAGNGAGPLRATGPPERLPLTRTARERTSARVPCRRLSAGDRPLWPKRPARTFSVYAFFRSIQLVV